MHNNLQDNQSFIDDAKSRGLDTLAYQDPKSQEFMLLAGHPESVRLLGEILDDYEMVCAVVEVVDAEVLEKWHKPCGRQPCGRQPCGQSAPGAKSASALGLQPAGPSADSEADRQQESSEQRSTHGESEDAR